MRETTIRIQVSIQTSTLSEIERALSALLYTHKIAHKTNEISRRSDRKDGGKRHGCGKERGGGGNKKSPFELLTIKYVIKRASRQDGPRCNFSKLWNGSGWRAPPIDQ